MASAPTIFGTLDDGRPIREVVLRSEAGAQMTVMEWGAVVRDLVVPCKSGMQRVVLGFADLDSYLKHSPHFGAVAGRYANRIAGGKFTLDGQTYQLPLNENGRNSLHGGGGGFSKRPWTILHHDVSSVTLGLVSPDGDNGYPGALHLTCRYTLAEPATLRMELTATTDAPTIVNLCQHSYFNLDGSADILDHELELRANLITPVNADLIPDGSLAHVGGSPFDFRRSRPIRLMEADGTRRWYDHNFMLRRDRTEPSVQAGIEIAHAATLRSRLSGISMEVWTSEPACQIYDGAKVSTPVPGHEGKPYGANAGICLEAQHVPDSPNLPHFPTTVLRPGAVCRQVTEYRFG
jgi:aldose 1-epimerase